MSVTCTCTCLFNLIKERTKTPGGTRFVHKGIQAKRLSTQRGRSPPALQSLLEDANVYDKTRPWEAQRGSVHPTLVFGFHTALFAHLQFYSHP